MVSEVDQAGDTPGVAVFLHFGVVARGSDVRQSVDRGCSWVSWVNVHWNWVGIQPACSRESQVGLIVQKPNSAT